MKLKNMLTEADIVNSDVVTLVKECEPYIKKNIRNIRKNNGLIRTTGNVYGIDKIKPRKRTSIKGSPWLYYLYETIKPSNFPSRSELVPCYGYEIHKKFGTYKYKIYPVGNKYKLVYTDGVADFNENHIISKYDEKAAQIKFQSINDFVLRVYIRTMAGLWDNIILKLVDFKDEAEFEERHKVYKATDILLTNIEDIRRTWKSAYNTKEISSFMSKYNKLIPKINKVFGAPLLKQLCENYIDVFAMSTKYMKEYLSKTHITDTLSDDMRKIEVGLYAPDGFYYMNDMYEEYFFEELGKLGI